jgi:hypothetical protein
MVKYGDLSFTVVRLEASGQEVIARAGNFEICKAAFERALFVYPTEHLEMRQGARVRTLEIAMAEVLHDSSAVPGNRLQRLVGNQKGQHSIRMPHQAADSRTWNLLRVASA